MINNSTNTPVYGGYHPNDLGFGWFGNYRVDSSKVIRFFNSVAMKTAPLVHSVNRGELIFRVSDGGFSIQAIRVSAGLTMVLKSWKNNNDLSHADIIRNDIGLRNDSTVETNTLEWLEQSWSSLEALINQSGLENISLPEFEELILGTEILEEESPPFFMEYSGTGSPIQQEEPSLSSEEGDLPSFSTDS
jgi:hypothetical protein